MAPPRAPKTPTDLPGWEATERTLASGTGVLYANGQSPFHAAVSRRYFGLLEQVRAR